MNTELERLVEFSDRRELEQQINTLTHDINNQKMVTMCLEFKRNQLETKLRTLTTSTESP